MFFENKSDALENKCNFSNLTIFCAGQGSRPPPTQSQIHFRTISSMIRLS